MNVLLIGSGGREHALAWKIAQSKKLTKLFIAPGNAGTAALGTNINIAVNDFNKLGEFASENKIDMVVVGPEDPLVNGISDYFSSNENLKNISVFGPSKKGAMLEGSKEYAKEFMLKHNIPTAKYFTVTNTDIDKGLSFLETMKVPYVLKADGLAAGKGVLIIENIDEAKNELKTMLDGKFGQASKKVVIEEFLSGIELSAFVITDGKNYIMLPEAKDYKRIGEGDTGLNTGGMGCVSPVPFASSEFMKKVEDRIIAPTINGLNKEGIPYIGFIFFGLMNCEGDPYVIEYNVRMGDPETEVIMPRLECDMIDVFLAASNNELDKVKISISKDACTTIMLVSGGYPGSYAKGKLITNLDKIDDCILFHAGTKLENGQVFTNGGRVLAVSALAEDFRTALEKCYKNANIITFENVNYRSDIGFDL